MRVTSSATFRNYTNNINNVHSSLNKSMKKVYSGKAYESAAENPLAYYEGKTIDNQYQDILSKLALTTDVKNRLYQQELGARSIQKTLSEAKEKITYIRSDSNNGDMGVVGTTRDALLQKQQSMISDLNGRYQNFYIYGGNDLTTPPFSLSDDGMELTFTHKFSSDDSPTKMVMTLKEQDDGSFEYEFSGTTGTPPRDMDSDETLEAILKTMKEQAPVDVGYGSISDRDTLLDTNTGGLNLLTGLSPAAIKSMDPSQAKEEIKKRLNSSPVGLVGQAAAATDKYMKDGNKSEFSAALGKVMDTMTETEHTVSTVYSDLGNKYALLEKTEDKLETMKLSLTEQYTAKLGANPYEAITEMYAYQESYNAALKIGSQIVSASLFDFMR
ncbi:MAG: flagellar hook-basal body protein [Clostridiales bacterium]|nr:flagellar hook-basal body protein [Clostridiales bacterium]